MKKLLILILILNYTLPIINAQNLVPNPSFEEYYSCPDNGSQLEKAKDWFVYYISPDYYNKCAFLSSGFSIPNNWIGYQCPSTGNGYIGLYTYISNPNTLYREIVYAELNNSLIIGEKYYVSFKVSNASNSLCACNKIGILFITNIDSTHYLLNNYSHIYFTNIITDTNWVEFKGVFIADSAYRYICIGNFYDNNNTDTLVQIQGLNCNSYYYIDDICVSEDSLTCVDITNEIIDFNTDTTVVNKGQCLNYTINTVVNYDYYEWHFDGGNPATSNLTNPTVCYDSMGTFNSTLIAYNNNGCGDTIIKQNYISVIEGEGINNFSSNFSLINNPSDNFIIIEAKTNIDIKNIHVYNILGKQIQTNISKNNSLIKITLNQNTKNGIYILKITNKNKSFNKKFVKF